MEINVFDYLEEELKGDIVYLPNRGNGGDALIAEGTYQVFERLDLKYSIFEAGSDYTEKTILIGGGGNLVQYYDYFEKIILGLHKSVHRIIILPHTISHKDELLSVLDERVDIICRERVSYEYVSNFASGGARVFLADDMAFSIDTDSLVNYGLLSRYLFMASPGEVKTFAKGVFTLKRYIRKFGIKEINAFRIDCEGADRILPEDNQDISALFLYNMKNRALVRAVTAQIMLSLGQCEVVNTDRLHLCIAAFLMGKSVSFYGNSYYKNRAIYDYSIKQRSEKINYLD
jgi:exopolysaccharide biosynthesis predicted pyruvyltransferase EpsI